MLINRVKICFGIAALLTVLLFALTGCSLGNGFTGDGEKDGLRIVCSNFPSYDFVMNIIGEKSEDIEVTYLLEKGVDMHSYQATADAVAKIINADLCVFTGGESEKWIEDVLKNNDASLVKTFRLMDVSNLKNEEIKEGMEHDGEDGLEYDEHVWLSLKNAVKAVDGLCLALSEADAENAEIYRRNADEYISEIIRLDTEYTEFFESADKKVIVVADRFPFLYLVKDYKIDYFAAFSGCSAETEAGFETIVFLAEKVKEYSLSTVLYTETSNGSLADAVISAVKSAGLDKPHDMKTDVLDSIQSVSKNKIEGGYSYIKAMRDNLETLKGAVK